MTVYEVQASVWRPASMRVFTRGDRLTEQQVERLGPVDSFRRLGLIQPITDSGELDGLTKRQLSAKAAERDIDIAGFTKTQIITALKED